MLLPHALSGRIQKGLSSSFRLILGFLLRMQGHCLGHCPNNIREVLAQGKVLSSMA